MQKSIFLCLFGIAVLFAQQPELNQLQLVGRPQKLETEIAAVRDVNGRHCTGIKVISDMDGFSYQSYNGVVKVNDHPGEDMVFLQPKERVLEIYHSGYEPLKVILSEIGIQPAPKAVWQIKVSGEKQLNQIPIVVITDPPGAEVTLDGKSYGAVEKLTVNQGNHQLRLQKDGYEPVMQTIIVDAENNLFKYTLEEVQDVPIEIITHPSDATVYLDDMKFGKTTLSEFYPSGRYPIRIEKQGYATYEDVLEVEPPRITKEITLQPDFGTLRVVSEPETGLSILLNGRSQNVTTPHTFERLPSGEYIVTAESNYFDTRPDTITVARGSQQTLTLRTRAAYATLTIRTLKDATVYLNDKPVQQLKNIRLEPMIAKVRVEHPKAEPVSEQVALRRGDQKTLDLYPDIATGAIQVAVVPLESRIQITGADGESFSGERSQVFSDIPIGVYTVRVTHDDYKPQEQTVTLKADATEKLRINLTTGSEPVVQSKKSKWLWYGIPAAVAVGAGVYLGTQKDGGSDKSSISVKVPATY